MTFTLSRKRRDMSVGYAAKIITSDKKDDVIIETDSTDLRDAILGYIDEGVLIKGSQGFFERVYFSDQQFWTALRYKLTNSFSYIITDIVEEKVEMT